MFSRFFRRRNSSTRRAIGLLEALRFGSVGLCSGSLASFKWLRLRFDLRHAEQRFLEVCIALFFLTIGLWYYQKKVLGPGLIEIERVETRDYLYTVELNRADWQEIMLLPEIGEGLAKRIVEHREKYGTYDRPEDLLDVKGIGPKTLEKIRPYLAPWNKEAKIRGLNGLDR